MHFLQLKDLLALDLALTAFFRGLEAPSLTPWALALSWLGSFKAMFLFTLLVSLFFLSSRRSREALIFALAMASSWGLIEATKALFARPRPELALTFAAGYSFPSGHALASTVFFGLLLALLKRKPLFLRALFFFLVLAVGLSRVYLGVHYLSDVVAGWLLGALWVTMWRRASVLLQRAAGSPPSQ